MTTHANTYVTPMSALGQKQTIPQNRFLLAFNNSKKAGRTRHPPDLGAALPAQQPNSAGRILGTSNSLLGHSVVTTDPNQTAPSSAFLE